MRLKLFLLLSITIGLISCDKDPNELILTYNNAGSLSVKAVDKNNVAIEGAKVEIYDSSDNYDPVYEGTTNASGVLSVGKLLQNTYYCKVFKTIGKVEYYDSKSFQIIAGEDKDLILVSLSNSGKIKMTFINVNDDNKNLVGLDIGVMPEDEYYEIYYSINGHVNDYVEAAHFLGKTDANGYIEFSDVPAHEDYIVFAYKGDKGFVVQNMDVPSNRKTDKEYTIKIRYINY